VHFYYDIDEWELYDRKKDVKEMTNVYDDPAYADVVKRLTGKLYDLRLKYGDSSKLDSMYLHEFLKRDTPSH